MDAGVLVNILRRPVIATDGVGQERTALSLRLALSVVAAHGGRAGMVRELESLVGRFPTVRLVQSAGAPARLEAGALRFVVPAPLRDALLAAAGNPSEGGAGAATGAVAAAGDDASPRMPARLPTGAEASTRTALTPVASSPSDAATPARAAPSTPSALPTTSPANAASAPAAAGLPTPAAMLAAPAADAPRQMAMLAGASQRAVAHWPATPEEKAVARASVREPAPAGPRMPLTLAAPLLDERVDAVSARVRLQSAVRDSGVFAEAQLARAIVREREGGAAATQREPVRIDSTLPPAERAAVQLDVLRREAFALSLAGWAGQPVHLDLGREPVDGAGGRDGAADGARVFVATLSMELAQLGAVTIRLRLANATLAARVEAEQAQRWHDALPELAQRLRACGLQPAALRACAREPQPDHAARR